MEKYNISILRPGGNDTLLVKGIVQKEKRKAINDFLMKKIPNVEQVGFYDFSPDQNITRLEMAGGEFCGNALRSLAYLLLNGKKGEIEVKVSGTKRILKAGVNKKSTAYAQMPIIKSFESVKQLNQDLWLVDLEGISYLIKKLKESLVVNKAKTIARKLLQENNLLYSKPAAGVIFIKRGKSKFEFEIQPVVWVRDIQTFFYETACATGSAAVGLWNAKENKNSKIALKIRQPSKGIIKVYVEKNKKSFKKAYIEGQIKIIKKGCEKNGKI